MSQAEFDINHNGQSYIVIVEYDTHTIDDSFDGHLGGQLHTFKLSHDEVNFETVEVISCTNDEDVEIDPDDVPGLMDRIEYEVSEIDPND